jgi:hypothetical protein
MRSMIKVRVREGKITHQQVLADIVENYGEFIDLDLETPSFEFEVYGLNLEDMQDVYNLRNILLDDVLEHSEYVVKFHYEFVGYDHYAKTNAVKVVVDNMVDYLENLI